jgi:hypothetical protein
MSNSAFETTESLHQMRTEKQNAMKARTAVIRVNFWVCVTVVSRIGIFKNNKRG